MLLRLITQALGTLCLYLVRMKRWPVGKCLPEIANPAALAQSRVFGFGKSKHGFRFEIHITSCLLQCALWGTAKSRAGVI